MRVIETVSIVCYHDHKLQGGLKVLKTAFFEMRQPAAFITIACGNSDLGKRAERPPSLRGALGANWEPRAFQGPCDPPPRTACDVARRRRTEARPRRITANADVAKSVDAADFNWSARGETRGAEPLKVGES